MGGVRGRRGGCQCILVTDKGRGRQGCCGQVWVVTRYFGNVSDITVFSLRYQSTSTRSGGLLLLLRDHEVCEGTSCSCSPEAPSSQLHAGATNRCVDRSNTYPYLFSSSRSYSGNRSRVGPTISTPEPKMNKVGIQLHPIGRRKSSVFTNTDLLPAHPSTLRASCLPAVKA